MPKYIAFLRAINVGGRNVTMEELRRLFTAAGFRAVETFIASGNVIFEAPRANDAALEKQIEDFLQRALGYEVTVFVRTNAEIAAVARYKPFSESQLAAALALNVAFLAAPLSPEATRALLALRTDIDDFHCRGREVYWLCKQRQSDSKFSNAVFERVLKLRATFRNVNTVVKLAARYPSA